MQPALALAQPLVAPVDRSPQRPLALGQIDRSFHLEREAVCERTEDLGRRKDDESCGDELDRQRQAVEPAADLVHRGERIGMEDDAACRRELNEERRRILDGQRLERNDVLARQPQRRTARRQHLEIRRTIEQSGDMNRRRREVLEVVEIEERAASR